MVEQHILLGAAVILWCAVHSLLIARRVTAAFRSAFGKRYALYRLFYVVFSTATLGALIVYERSIPAFVLFSWTFPWTVLQWAMLAAGLAVIAGGAMIYDQRYFFGFRQIADYRSGKEESKGVLKAEGILKYVRHPYYTGTIIVVLFFGDVTSTLAVLKVVFIAYTIVGTLLEERKLKEEFGGAYLEYASRVPMLIPNVRSLLLRGGK